MEVVRDRIRESRYIPIPLLRTYRQHRRRKESIPQWHPLHLVTQRPPVVRLQLGVFDAFLTPVLVQPADVILALLEVDQFVSHALPDEHPAGMLLHDGFFVLFCR